VNWLDVLFPKTCFGCGKWGAYICDRCDIGMVDEEQICPVCCRASRYGMAHDLCKKPAQLDGLICFWEYSGVVKKCISEAKYFYYFDVLRTLSRKALDILDRDEFNFFCAFLDSSPAIVPVPLYAKRERERGFNQAEIVGGEIIRQLKLDSSHLLVRTHDTGQQVGRTREERLESMKDAFTLNSQPVIPKNALIVDDVWTTGATMSECARVLKRSGVNKVWGLALAR